MKYGELEERFINAFVCEWMLIESKNHDYATDADCLSNFKRMAAYTGLTIYGVAMFFVYLKVDRMKNLFSQQKRPLNETVIDSIRDCRNYLFLLEMLLTEANAGTKFIGDSDKLDAVVDHAVDNAFNPS
jgi:hypothetical protein